ncbi:hypothetical protein N7452_004850 [Penicillium brevicompactum]|uniref:Uncharacterized protein n=1 Tax=Penicillium brevicompactum TaxID=5074 RepID=A0A9W9UEL1_PENBR|nr:hypothetical protein N7452_004850 [Penicillium brevicompactum]
MRSSHTKQIFTDSIENLHTHFPGLAAMVNLFGVALNRQAASRSSCAKASVVPRAAYERRQNAYRSSTLSFDFKNLEKGSRTPMAQVLPARWKEEHDGSFMPIVGDGRKEMMDVIAEFKPVEDEDL